MLYLIYINRLTHSSCSWKNEVCLTDHFIEIIDVPIRYAFIW